MLVGRICCSEFAIVFCAIADAAQHTIAQQVGNISEVTRMNLRISLGNRGMSIRRVLQFEDAERNTIDKE